MVTEEGREGRRRWWYGERGLKIIIYSVERMMVTEGGREGEKVPKRRKGSVLLREALMGP